MADGKVIYLFKEYLLARGTCTLTSLLKPGSQPGVEAWFQDQLLAGIAFWRVGLCASWVEHTEHGIFNGANLHTIE